MSKMSFAKHFLLVSSLAAAMAGAVAADNPFLGEWELTIPGGGAGWLGVAEKDGALQANLLWGGGSVFPLASAKVEDGRLILERNHEVQRTDATGKKTRVKIVETITATLHGDRIDLTGVREDDNDPTRKHEEHFAGKRQPPMPPAPDLTKVKFGPPISLFNGRDLTGWRLTDPHAANGWTIKNGLLINNAAHEEGKPRKNYGNLRTDREFEDFNLKVEVNVGKDENSGVYLRGIYEVQVADTYGHPVDSHNMGAVYSRIKPTMAAEKPPGEWQTLEITLVDRHVSVELNGKRIIDNQPVMGCTGGALSSDVSKPGPIYLQGDHTSITYRSLVLRPVLRR
jgi:hypothetical protein